MVVDLILNSAGDPVVNRLAPGGPAWNSNIISEGDTLVAY